MTAYYNEIDPFAAQWLRNLISVGFVADGEVDERSITDVKPSDLAGFAQCHFFAGIGVWSYALRLAGWPDDQPVWTASCPCQPFSAAGKRGGIEDERHLWPAVARLMCECSPGTLFGEQVASKDGLAWLDTVHADLEAEGYAVGALDTCAAGFGAPHIRQRLYFVADSRRERSAGRGDVRDVGEAQAGDEGAGGQRQRVRNTADDRRAVGELADADGQRTRANAEALQAWQSESCVAGDVGDTDDAGSQGRSERAGTSRDQLSARQAGATNGFWSDAHWLACIDGKARPVEPGTFPLAHGIAGRVGRLRAYGNCIVAPQAAEFIRAYMSL